MLVVLHATQKMTQKINLGKTGEDIACKYLVDNHYKIIERNFRKPWGEIDIITKSLCGTLVFIEVKTMKEFSGGLTPENQLTSLKLERLKKTAYLYANNNQKLIKEETGWRIDLVALTINEKSCDIKHYKNIA